METTTLTAPDISCDHCRQTVEREVGALTGVEGVVVNVPSKHVTITYDPATVSRRDIEAALDEAGYPVVEVSG